jgi:exopolysaccharide biosynthesis polyprenyl glycosylphosphotransferase
VASVEHPLSGASASSLTAVTDGEAWREAFERFAPARAEATVHGASRLRRLLVGADGAALAAALLLAVLIVGPAGDRRWISPSLVVTVCALFVTWVAGSSLFGLYRRDVERADHSTIDELGPIFLLVTAQSWLLAVGVHADHQTPFRFSAVVVFWILAFPLLALSRAAARSFLGHRAELLQNTVIVGAGEVGQLVARKLLHHPEYRCRLLGLVDDRPTEKRGDLDQLTLLGTLDDVSELIRVHDVDRVIVAFSNEPVERTLTLVRTLSALGLRVDVVPRIFEAMGPSTSLDTVEGIPLIVLPARAHTRAYAVAKRTLDVVVAAAALIVASPLFAVIAWKIRRDSPGPVFFRQTRCGLGLRQFTSLKFRTMRVDAPVAPHEEYIRATMASPASADVNGLFKLEREDAITATGRWLRKTSLDELPQLINVLRGDMSLVGPRPCIPYEVQHFQTHHLQRFFVPAGLTGLWQVTARAHCSFAEALDMDVLYAGSCSFWLDLRLLLRTPVAMLTQLRTR